VPPAFLAWVRVLLGGIAAGEQHVSSLATLAGSWLVTPAPPSHEPACLTASDGG
jgi:hypothetical protein